MGLEFTKKHNNFLLEETQPNGQKRIVSAFVNLAFVFDPSGSVLHKFGEDIAMQRFFLETRNAYLHMGFTAQANSIVLISSDIWPIDLVNKFINKPGFITQWYREQDIKFKET